MTTTIWSLKLFSCAKYFIRTVLIQSLSYENQTYPGSIDSVSRGVELLFITESFASVTLYLHPSIGFNLQFCGGQEVYINHCAKGNSGDGVKQILANSFSQKPDSKYLGTCHFVSCFFLCWPDAGTCWSWSEGQNLLTSVWSWLLWHPTYISRGWFEMKIFFCQWNVERPLLLGSWLSQGQLELQGLALS